MHHLVSSHGVNSRGIGSVGDKMSPNTSQGGMLTNSITQYNHYNTGTTLLQLPQPTLHDYCLAVKPDTGVEQLLSAQLTLNTLNQCKQF